MTDYTQDQLLAVAKLIDYQAVKGYNSRCREIVYVDGSEFVPLSNDTCVALIEKLKICTETTLHETKAYMRGWVGTSCYAPTINEAALACAVKVTESK